MLIDSYPFTPTASGFTIMSLPSVPCLAIVLALMVVLAPFAAHAASSFSQRAVLLSEGGAYPFISVGDQDVPDLAAWEFDNNAHFACVIGM